MMPRDEVSAEAAFAVALLGCFLCVARGGLVLYHVSPASLRHAELVWPVWRAAVSLAIRALPCPPMRASRAPVVGCASACLS